MTKKSIQQHKQLSQPQSNQSDFMHEFATLPQSENSKLNNKKRKKNQ